MAVYRRVYDLRHLQADCQEPGSAPEPYAWQSSMGYLYLFYYYTYYYITTVFGITHYTPPCCCISHNNTVDNFTPFSIEVLHCLFCGVMMNATNEKLSLLFCTFVLQVIPHSLYNQHFRAAHHIPTSCASTDIMIGLEWHVVQQQYMVSNKYSITINFYTELCSICVNGFQPICALT